jgi:hypothetical protein
MFASSPSINLLSGVVCDSDKMNDAKVMFLSSYLCDESTNETIQGPPLIVDVADTKLTMVIVFVCCGAKTCERMV